MPSLTMAERGTASAGPALESTTTSRYALTPGRTWPVDSDDVEAGDGGVAYVVRDAQDDGDGLLFSVYRYLDARLGALHGRLDADDVLIVMSDHGIRTAMEHSRFAFFVADGDDVPAGRAPGTPALRGVSRAIADLLEVDTAWPDTGLAPWARPAKLARGNSTLHPAQRAP